MEVNKSSDFNFLYKLFCWCSGARLYLLKQCPTDFNKYFGIGIIVVFTGIMAAISGGYALYTIFNTLLISVIFGFIWGMLIFFLDWYILASLKKEKQFSKEFLNTLPRILLAILLGLIISKPLELKLFEKEIKQELISMQKDLDNNYKNKIIGEIDEINILQNENEKLLNEIQIKETYRDSLFKLIIEEAEGKSPTATVGKGPVYREKKQEFDKINNELTELKTRNLANINQNKSRINAISENRENELKMGMETSKNYDGFLAQIQALSLLAKNNKAIKYVNFFVILLFVIIEASPMLVKLMAQRGAYDILFEYEEQKNSAEIKKKTSELELNNIRIIDAELDIEIQKLKTKNELKRHEFSRLKKAKKQIINSKISYWKNSQVKSKPEPQSTNADEQLFSF